MDRQRRKQAENSFQYLYKELQPQKPNLWPNPQNINLQTTIYEKYNEDKI